MSYLVSKMFEFIIPSGATGVAISPVDLGMNYDVAIISCDDLTGVPVNTTLRVQVGEKIADTPRTVYLIDTPGTAWGEVIPASGSYRVVCLDAFGARLLRVVLDKAVTQSKIFIVYGLNGSGG